VDFGPEEAMRTSFEWLFGEDEARGLYKGTTQEIFWKLV
jgi:hypothetical protein